jgi:hypothetical protein
MQPGSGSPDVALIGTGLAPLVAANHLSAQGKSVLVLNPDFDFFLEDSELPIDPLWPVSRRVVSPERLRKGEPERALAELRPDFPGAIEYLGGQGESMRLAGFHDPAAPHVRARSRLWIAAPGGETQWNWDTMEEIYVETSDADLNPQILDGLAAVRRFPGVSAAAPESAARGLLIPKSCDVDVARYRHGLLEYVRERLGPDGVVSDALDIQLMPGGLRFHAGGVARTTRVREGVLVFWTPRLTSWVEAQARKAEVTPFQPRGTRLWEQWSLMSREPIDTSVIGILGDLAVWADLEGAQGSEGDAAPHRLAVLRAGPLIPPAEVIRSASWAGGESLAALSSLCHGFLGWERYTVRSMRPRAIFEWEYDNLWSLTDSEPRVQVVPACDGPLVDVVRRARLACGRLGEERDPQLPFTGDHW